MTVAVCSPPLGRLLDRYGPRPVILPCMIVFGVAFVSLSLLTPSLVHLLRRCSLCSEWLETGRRRWVIPARCQPGSQPNAEPLWRWVVAGVGVGSMVFPKLAQRVIDAQGWRSAYVVLGLIILALGVPLTASFCLRTTGNENGFASYSIW